MYKIAMLLFFTGYAWAQSPGPTLTTLHSGLGAPNPILVAKDGVIYGTTYDGKGYGQAYSLTPPTSPGAAWTYTVLYTFSLADGELPTGPSAIGHDGGLYGVTHLGGGGNCPILECGVVYELTPPSSPGESWTQTVLYAFTQNSASRPNGLVIGPAGMLYGSTSYDTGTLFMLSKPSSKGEPWTYNQLYAFSGGSDGAGPGALTVGSDGVLYGTTSSRGMKDTLCPTGCGTVFQITSPVSPGDPWTLTVLHSFTGGSGGQGYTAGPSGLTIGNNGSLYGTLTNGGNSACTALPGGCGTVFALDPPASPGGPWVYRTIYSFTGGSDGANPSGGLLLGEHGELIGTASQGGASLYGTIFSLSPPASQGGSWTETTLYAFTGSNGSNPGSGVVFGAGGALYGVTVFDGNCTGQYCGTVFSLH
jgi:hypothetical protein